MPGLLPDGAAFGVGSPAETAGQPSGLAGLLGGAYDALGLLAKRAFGASEMMRTQGTYDPAPMVEAAMLPMGTGAIAGVPMRAGEAVFGAGPIRMYHATTETFDKFGPAPAYRGATYLAATPEAAQKGATGGAGDWYGMRRGPHRTLEVSVPDEGISGLHWTPEEADWFNSLPRKVVGDDALQAALAGQPKGSQIIWDDVYQPKQVGERLFEYTRADAPKQYSLEEAARTNRDIYGRQLPGYADNDRASAERLRKQGMKGFLVNDEAGVSVAHIDPEILKILSIR